MRGGECRGLDARRGIYAWIRTRLNDDTKKFCRAIDYSDDGCVHNEKSISSLVHYGNCNVRFQMRI